MVFTQPLFFFALISLSIPIIIHLYNFRKYKKIYFTNVKFIAEIKQESKKRNQLKHLLILIARLLAITCLVFAFAQPYLPSPLHLKKLASKQAISVYIDNSFSMDALSQSGRLLDEAKGKAREILQASKPSDLFQLVTNDFEGRHQRFVSRDEFQNLIEEVKLSASVRSLTEVLKRQSDLLSLTGNSARVSYLITDFQKSTSGLTSLKTDSNVTCFFVPVQSGSVNNLSVDSVWFDNPTCQPGQPAKLYAKIRNNGSELLEKIPLRLFINKIPKSVASFSVQPKSETVVPLIFTNNTSGIQYGFMEIADYPVIWDDKFYLSYRITPAIPVLAINENNENPYLQALFGSDTTFTFTNANNKQLDYSSFARYSTIILNNLREFSTGLINELSGYVKNGGSIIVFPSTDPEISGYQNLITALEIPSFTKIDTTRMKVTAVNTESKLFQDVFEKDKMGKPVIPENPDFPFAFRHHVMNLMTRSNTEILMSLQNGNPFLTVTSAGKGKIYLFAASLDERSGNFPKNPLFVPTLYKMALLSQQTMPLYYSLPAEEGVEVIEDSVRNRETYKIRKSDGENEIIPEIKSMGSVTRLYPHDQIKEAGNYDIIQGGRSVQGISFNYNRLESDLSFYSFGEIEDLLQKNNIGQFALLKGKSKSLTEQITQLNQGVPLWKYFIIGTLLFLLMEILIARFLKD